MRRSLAGVLALVGFGLMPYFGSPSSATNPPVTAAWTRSSHNPILTATAAWEIAGAAWVQEPTVFIDGSNYVMYYTGGGGAGHYAMGRATCPVASDPTNGANWTKYASNPVIGQGGSSISGDASRNFVTKVGSTYYAYYSNAANDLKVTTSSDGIAWGAPTTALAHNAAAFATGWVNLAVWNEGGTAWKMLIEAVGGTVSDRIVAATTSTDGITWATPATGAIASLEITSGTTGGPAVMQFHSAYQLYYHAANNGTGLPTDIYHASSADLATWTISPATPVLTHQGPGTFEYDQVADPSVLVYNGTAYLFYTGANNTSNEGGPLFKIGVASAPAIP